MNKTITSVSRIWMIASLCLFIAIIVYVLMYPPGKGNAISSEVVVAKVNGTTITKEQLYEAMLKSGGSQTLESLISEELVRQEAEKNKIEITDADLNNEIDGIKKNFGSEEEFQAALASYDMTLDSLKNDMVMQVQIRKLLEPKVTLTDEEVHAHYDNNKDSYAQEEQVRASHILVDTKEEADTILTELKGGADFAAIAQEKSKDTGSAASGGDLNFFGRGEMVEPFENAAFSLAVGQLSDVVESTHGFHIIKVTDKKEASTPTLEEKQEDIRRELMDQGIAKLYSSWLNEIRTGATIESNL